MEAPKCKFCGVVEWRHICGGIANQVYGKARDVVPRPVRAVRVPSGRGVEIQGSIPDGRGKTHNEYMRDYMRVWRAVKAGRACLLKV